MPEEIRVKKLYKWKLIASNPNIRWMDTAMIDIQAVRIVNCRR
jgi:hypothetical protein